MSYSAHASPQHGQGPYGAAYGPVYRYEPLGWRTTAAAIGILGGLVLGTTQSALALAFRDVLTNPVRENLGVILGVGAIGLAQGVVGLGTFVFFFMWIYQAAKNVRAFGQPLLEYAPGWCIGWWFIPVASLWKPFCAMREIWKASDPDTVGPNARGHWMSAPVPAMLGAWWASYVLRAFVGTGVALSTLDFSGGRPVSTGVNGGAFIMHGISAIAGVLVVIILFQIARRQEASWQRISGVDLRGAPPAPGAYGGSGISPYAAPEGAPNPYAPPAGGFGAPRP